MRRLRSLPPALWILAAGALVNRAGSYVVALLPLYLTRAGYGTTTTGLATGAAGAGLLGSALVGGRLSDRIGPRAAIAGSLTASGVTAIGLLDARAAWLIVALAALHGVASSAYRAPAAVLVAMLVPEPRRVTGFAAYRLGVNVGAAVGGPLAGVLLARGASALFVFEAVTSFAFAALVLARMPRARGTGGQTPGGAGVLRDRRFAPLLAATALLGFVYFQSVSTFTLAARDAGAGAAAIGLLLGLNALIVIACELPLTGVTEPRPAAPVMALGAALLGLGATALLADAAPALVAAIVLWSFGEILFEPGAVARVARLATSGRRGAYQGAWALAWTSPCHGAAHRHRRLPARARCALDRLRRLRGACRGALARPGSVM